MNMKVKLILGGTAVGCLTLAGCGGGSEPSAAVPSPIVTQQLDTAAVLAIAQKTSETESPFAVDGDLVVVTPADDETGTPIPVNAI
jgi:hypothetical protein